MNWGFSKSTNISIVYVFVLSVLAALLGCTSAEREEGIVRECVLPAGQSGTVVARWPITPIPVAFKSGDFSAGELKAMAAALNTWNEFYNASQGFPLFSFGSVGSPNLTEEEAPVVVCSKTILQGSGYVGSFNVYKRTSWPFDSEIIALTSFCPNSIGEKLDSIYMGMMELNFDTFFSSGKIPDLESIFLHESGHALGLGHPCETFDKSGVPNCNSGDVGQDVFEAALFPVIFFPNGVNGEQRRVLRSNDQGRANCLYDEGFNS